jgi:hypothetical protein
LSVSELFHSLPTRGSNFDAVCATLRGPALSACSSVVFASPAYAHETNLAVSACGALCRNRH